MKHTPGQFFIAIMENQWQAKLPDDKIVRLMEDFNRRKYRAGIKLVQQYRRAYNRGEMPGQDGKPIQVPQYKR